MNPGGFGREATLTDVAVRVAELRTENRMLKDQIASKDKIIRLQEEIISSNKTG